MTKPILAYALSAILSGCAGHEIRSTRFHSAGASEAHGISAPKLKPMKPTHPTEQLTKHDCGITSLEHAAKVWEVDISATLDPALREQPSSLNSLAEIAQKFGFDAFVLQAGTTGENPFRELTSHLKEERPLVILLRFPSAIGPLMSYVRKASGDATFSGNAASWVRHFVVLTKCSEIAENGIARKFTMMEPSRGAFREVDTRWLDLFWRRQDAKYLLISK